MEEIWVAHWEGPLSWDDCMKEDKEWDEALVLYALYGCHPVYGGNVLLYIGKTNCGVGQRLCSHDEWVCDEYDAMSVRVASIGRFMGWKHWDEADRYRRADADSISAIEALLIRANQPAYNSSAKQSSSLARKLRVFNTGHFGHMLPEVSSLYHFGE